MMLAQPPDAGIESAAGIARGFRAGAVRISAGIGGSKPTPPRGNAARWQRPACANVGCADIATATPSTSAKAPARSMYLAASNSVISCQFLSVSEVHGVCSVPAE